MKKLFVLLLGAILVVSTGFAQDKEAKKALSKAKSGLNTFNLDQGKNDKIAEAYANIQLATNDDVLAAESSTWNLKGDIFSALSSKILQANDPNMAQFTQSEGLPEVKNPPLDAFEAYKKGLELAEKGRDKKNALTGLFGLQNTLVNFGAQFFSPATAEYDLAFANFQACLDAHDILKENGEDSALDEPEDRYEQQLYYTSLAAIQAKKNEEGRQLVQKLIDMEYDDPIIYEAMYSLVAQMDDDDEAYKYLEMGRQRYPDSTSLLFVEINHFLRAGKLDVLIDKLKQGIDAEPENASLYATLGNVYDQLYQKSIEDGDQEKANEYFDGAMSYFNQSLEKDPDYVDAVYSIGALYYNKAALMTRELVVLEDDYSKEGTAKYKQLQEDVFAQFDKALPFFQKAESMNPSDRNTLIALKEIYAKKNDLDMSNVFKERLETLDAGGSIDSSYFDK